MGGWIGRMSSWIWWGSDGCGGKVGRVSGREGGERDWIGKVSGFVAMRGGWVGGCVGGEGE